MAIKLHPSIQVHPGPWLKRQFVEPYGYTTKALADHFGVSRQALSTLLNGHAALSAAMAIRFESAFGIDATTMLRMQASYDLAQAVAHKEDFQVGRLEKIAA